MDVFRQSISDPTKTFLDRLSRVGQQPSKVTEIIKDQQGTLSGRSESRPDAGSDVTHPGPSLIRFLAQILIGEVVFLGGAKTYVCLSIFRFGGATVNFSLP